MSLRPPTEGTASTASLESTFLADLAALDARVDTTEAAVAFEVRTDQPNVFTAGNGDAGTGLTGLTSQITIAPTSAVSVTGNAEIHLVPNDAAAPSGLLQFQERTAIIRFFPERNYEADASIKVHRHTAGDPATPNLHHFVIHTTNVSTGDLTDRFSIEYGKDDPHVKISTAHLTFHTNAYIRGQGDSDTGAVPIHGVPSITSQGASTNSQLEIGRTAGEVRLGVAGGAASFSSDAAAGDLVVRHDTNTAQILLQTGNAGSALRISASAGNAPKLGFFGKVPIVQPTGGSATAAGTYGATEQGMLQRAYDALRTLGLAS